MNKRSPVNKPEHGGRVEETAEKVRLNPQDIVDFSANLNPLAPPRGTEASIEKALPALTCYPDDRYHKFREAVSNFLEKLHGTNLNPKQLIPANGSLELIRILAHYARYEEGRSVLIPQPTFSEYSHQTRILGLEVEKIPYEDLLKLEASRLSGYQLVFFCNPNNPTGELVPKDELEVFARKCRKADTCLAVDEAFIELSNPSDSMIDLTKNFPTLILIRSLTKSFSIPGARVGFGVAGKKITRDLELLRPTWNLNSLAVELTKHILGDGVNFLSKSRQYIKKERSYLSTQLSALGFNIYPGRANFLLCDGSDLDLTASKLTEQMVRRGLLLRNADSFDGLDKWHFRVAVKRKEENRRLIEELDRVLQNVHRYNEL